MSMRSMKARSSGSIVARWTKRSSRRSARRRVSNRSCSRREPSWYVDAISRPPRKKFATSVTGLERVCNRSVRPADRAGTVAGMDGSTALSTYFGFEAFRRGQREACEAAVAGRDVLVVMPTGSGKSLCYQLPALVRDDLTIVVSPLVALMQDQVDALRARGLGERVALVNAQQDGAANADSLARACSGDLRLLYVSPERFSSPGFVERIGRARIGLFVVDEV